MTIRQFFCRIGTSLRVAAIVSVGVFSSAGAWGQARNPPDTASTLKFGSMEYVHRWSKDGQNEFTPAKDSDLARWHDMVTINVHETVRNGDQLDGKDAGPAMSEWLQTNGPTLEKTLMDWNNTPSLAALKQLPQSK